LPFNSNPSEANLFNNQISNLIAVRKRGSSQQGKRRRANEGSNSELILIPLSWKFFGNFYFVGPL